MQQPSSVPHMRHKLRHEQWRRLLLAWWTLQLRRRWLWRLCAWLTRQKSVSGLPTSVLAHGKAVQSSVQHFFGPLKIGPTVPGQDGRRQRDQQQLNGLQSRWQRSCLHRKRLLRMRQ